MMRLPWHRPPAPPSPAQDIRSAVAELNVVRDRLTEVTQRVHEAAVDLARKQEK